MTNINKKDIVNLKEVYKMDIKILSPLQTERLGDELWTPLSPFKFSVDGIPFEVPTGFVYDGNSTPQLFWAVCAPIGGVFGEAGLPHDLFYSKDCKYQITRKFADQVHRAIGRMKTRRHRASVLRSALVYTGLRLFGRKAFKKKYSIEKLTKDTCYDLEYAKKRVIELRKVS